MTKEDVTNVLNESEVKKVVTSDVDGTSKVQVSPVIKSTQEVTSQPFGRQVTLGNVMKHLKYDIKSPLSSPPVSPNVLEKTSPETTIGDLEREEKTDSSSSTIRRKCLSRGPRIPFSTEQVSILESKFNNSHYLSSREVLDLACRLDISEQRVSDLGFST